MPNYEDIKKYAGEDNFQRAPKMPNYPYLRLDGNEGVFTLTSRAGDKSEKVEQGTSVDVIMLRVRRRLSDFNSGKSTTEHNHKGDNVVLFQTDSETYATRKIDTGSAEEIRGRHGELITEQVIYGLYKGELVRLVVKGGSLGSENEPKGSVPFYDYLKEFKGDDHIWMFHTTIKPIAKMNKKLRKSYYAMTFEKGEKANEVELDVIFEHMKTLYELIKEQDDYQGNTGRKTVDPAKLRSLNENVADKEPEDEVPVINLEDEIKPEDIPF